MHPCTDLPSLRLSPKQETISHIRVALTVEVMMYLYIKLINSPD